MRQPGPRFFGISGLKGRCLELEDIDGAIRVRPPACRVIVGDQERALDREGAAQVVKQLPEIRARLRVIGLGPQEKGEVLTGLRDVGMQDEVREERLQPVRTHRLENLLFEDEAQLAQQLDAQHSCMVRLSLKNQNVCLRTCTVRNVSRVQAADRASMALFRSMRLHSPWSGCCGPPTSLTNSPVAES